MVSVLPSAYQVADSVEEVVGERECDSKFGREDRGAAELHRLKRRESVPEIPLGRQRKNRGSWRDKIIFGLSTGT